MMGWWNSLRTYFGGLWSAWDRFWFAAIDPAALSMIRLLAGTMLLYTHAVWTFDLSAFFGPNGWLPADFMAIEHGRDLPLAEQRYFFSLFDYVTHPAAIWTVHVLSLLVFAMLAVGFCTRWVKLPAALLALSYVERVTPGAFFGLDKVNCMLAIYLSLGPCGARYSMDRLLAMRRGNSDTPLPSWSANVAIRLMQIHLAVMYLFAGLGKLQGDSWWDGSAVWLSVANLEYQSLDMTWMARHTWLMDLLTHATVFWEVGYLFLIWHPAFRGWMLLIAVGMHGFIAICMGMITFAVAMLIANVAFVSPEGVRRWWDPVAQRLSLLVARGGDAAGKPEKSAAKPST